MITVTGKYTTADIMIDDVEQETLRQIYAMVNHPAAVNRVAIMPDCHAGMGCVIGFTMKASTKVVPNWVGVDVGCGMLSCRLNANDLSNDVLLEIDKRVRQAVPMGKQVHASLEKNVTARFLRLLGQRALQVKSPLCRQFVSIIKSDVDELLSEIGMNESRFWCSLGTLGGGNHFIEIGQDEEGWLWLTVHTGSRNFGKVVCEHFDKLAQKKLTKVDIQDYVDELKLKTKKGELKNHELEGLIAARRELVAKRDFDVKTSAYVEGDDLERYLSFMFVAQVYAELNRAMIVEKIISEVEQVINRNVSDDNEIIETVHNFISFEDNVIRKGAVQSLCGRQLVIPFNMRDGLLICEGLSNESWNNSAPHGAGRVLSRRQAKDKISLDDYTASMNGIFTTSVGSDTLDESPMAYKDAKMIEEAIKPTAKIIHKVRPVFNLKAGGE